MFTAINKSRKEILAALGVVTPLIYYIIKGYISQYSCASLLLAKGIPMKMIQDWLGHSDMATTANIYSHIDSTSKKETAQAIGELLG